MFNQVSTEIIQQVENQLTVLGPAPFLIRMGTTEPLILAHLLYSMPEIWHGIRGISDSPAWRSEVQQ